MNVFPKVDPARRTLIFASATHVWSDLFFAILVPLLVLMKEDPELDLSFAQVGLIRAVHSGASAVLQVPFGFAAEKAGEFWLLLGGNIWVAASFLGMAAASSYSVLFAWTLISGLGGGTQHPLASGLVSRVYDASRRSTAVGTVNFAGDLGKMAAPAAAWLLAVPFGWRATFRIVGLAGIAFMAISVAGRRLVGADRLLQIQERLAGDGIRGVRMAGYVNLSVVGVMDDAVRAAALTFLPFLMRDRGMSTEQIFGMLFLLLAGGAMGKLVCGWLDERYGSVTLIWGTKGLTAALLLATLVAPTIAMAPLVLVLGVGLNGTSSVLYASVAKFVPPQLRTRFYGIFYTTIQIGSTFSPFAYGVLADWLDLQATVVIMGLATALILPVSLSLRRHLLEPQVEYVPRDEPIRH